MTTIDLSGKVALVTGGASGLGGATVRRLVADGAKAVVLDLPSSPGEAFAAGRGDAVRFVPTDVRDQTQVQAAVDAARELGELRIAVSTRFPFTAFPARLHPDIRAALESVAGRLRPVSYTHLTLPTIYTV